MNFSTNFNMEQIKSERESSITYFEDLSTELIYEIFDFLDFCHVYEAFSNLNIRFENLLTDSAYPIKMNLSNISKSIFPYYHTNIIIPYQHRIQSLRLSNPYIFVHIFSPSTDFKLKFNPYDLSCALRDNRVFSPVSTLLNFIRLESLIINTIYFHYLEELLNHLHLLPNLYSLVIMPVYTSDRCKFYQQIFRLPALKYCKLSIEKSRERTILPFATNEFSPITHLVIEDELDFSQVYTVLSYVPQLRRFSCRSCDYLDLLDGEFRNEYILNHLTHVSLDVYITFDRFESLIKNLFYQVEVLYISVRYGETYLDANRWERLILSHMLHLRIFNVMLSYESYEHATSVEFIAMIDQFNSSFWFERQWFFEYQIYDTGFPAIFDFYSINPYRRKKYIFRDEMLKERYPHPFKRKINSVHDVVIANRKGMYNCMYFFPNANELTLHTCAGDNKTSLVTRFSRIIPFKRLTKLVLYYDDISQIIELLQYTPNIHTLKISYRSFESVKLEPMDSKTFELVSKTNNIKKMSILSECTLECIEYFLSLCPQLQHITIEKNRNKYVLEKILRLLLSKHEHNAGYLSSLRIRVDSSIGIYKQILLFVHQEKLLEDFLWYMRQVRGGCGDYDLYLWW